MTYRILVGADDAGLVTRRALRQDLVAGGRDRA